MRGEFISPEVVAAQEKETVIEDITNRKEQRTDPEIEDHEWIDLSYGSKLLTMIIYRGSGPEPYFVETFLRKKESSEDKKPHETTFLYEAMKRIIENLVESEMYPYEYKLSTKNKKMIAWAKTTGATLFDWDDVHIVDPRKGKSSFYKEFVPKEKKQTV